VLPENKEKSLFGLKLQEKAGMLAFYREGERRWMFLGWSNIEK
jgi:hypothetical protein